MRTGGIAFHLWGQQHAWLQGKKARTSVIWAAAPVNELPLSWWGVGTDVFAQQKAMQTRDQKEALVMARSPGATRQKMPPTMESSAQGLRRKGPLFWQKVPRFCMEPSEAEY